MDIKKVVLIPDSFKGTLSSSRVCEIMNNSIKSRYPECEVVQIPVADGGEGTVDCFLQAVGGRKRTVRVPGPFLDPVSGFYGILENEEKTAVIEMAACAGLPLAEGRENPEKTSTYGVGGLIADALEQGCRKFVLGLGGSATNDGGCGMAAALGVRFLNKAGNPYLPTGGNLMDLGRIDMTGLHPALKECRFTAMCDIDNPMYGPLGAAYIFGPQKGADEAMAERLDAGLRHLSGVLAKDLGREVSRLPGAGAAGGMGGGAAAFLQAELRSGIEVVLDTVRFDEKIEGADVIFTGEGRLDYQSLMGKVVGGVAQRAKRKGIPLVAVAGSIDENTGDIYASGVSAAFSITRKPVPFLEARGSSEENLAYTMGDILRLLEIPGAANSQIPTD